MHQKAEKKDGLLLLQRSMHRDNGRYSVSTGGSTMVKFFIKKIAKNIYLVLYWWFIDVSFLVLCIIFWLFLHFFNQNLPTVTKLLKSSTSTISKIDNTLCKASKMVIFLDLGNFCILLSKITI